MRSILGICLGAGLLTVDAAEWHTLKNCQFVSKEYNDGDSFHVEHRGKEYIFRLYFVDVPETEERLAERIAEQAAYWKVSTTETMQLAKRAAEFTEQQLKIRPFTVFTKWDPARGDSNFLPWSVVKISFQRPAVRGQKSVMKLQWSEHSC